MRLIDADALKGMMIETLEKIKANPKMDNQEAHVIAAFHTVGLMIDDAPTVCCETCKHGIKGERIGDYEYFTCVKPYAEMSNSHIKNWFCGDWRSKDAVG